MDYDKAMETTLAGEWQEWLHLVWTVRDNVRELRLKHFAGTRELIRGIRGLADGDTLDEVANIVLRRNLDDATWNKVTK
jgi:hypothetical protein